jgi:hypothetical protein
MIYVGRLQNRSKTAFNIERIREEWFREHRGYYGQPCGNRLVWALDGVYYKCGYTCGPANAFNDTWDTTPVTGYPFRWIRSSGTVVEFVRDESAAICIRLVGRRHSLKEWLQYTSRVTKLPIMQDIDNAETLVYETVCPELPPYETT